MVLAFIYVVLLEIFQKQKLYPIILIVIKELFKQYLMKSTLIYIIKYNLYHIIYCTTRDFSKTETLPYNSDRY